MTFRHELRLPPLMGRSVDRLRQYRGDMLYSEDELLPISALADIVFCDVLCELDIPRGPRGIWPKMNTLSMEGGNPLPP